MPFQKGNNANPKGTRDKPKEEKVSTWLKIELLQLASLDDSKMEGYEAAVSKAKLIAHKMVDKALKDDNESLAYIKELLDRTEGKPKQTTEIGGVDGKDVIVRMISYKDDGSNDTV